MKYILGEKVEMTQFFDEGGRAHAATVLRVMPGTVTQVKTKEKDGYMALQIGFGTRRDINVNKAQKGAWKDLPTFSVVKEFRVDTAEARKNIAGAKVDMPALGRGDSFGIDTFAVGDMLILSGVSKGKGFQGVVKRHGFKGGRRTHGQKHSEREPGSIAGGGRAGGRVAKGMRMAGRMGGDRITIKNLKVLALDTKQNLMVVKGAVPGRRGTVLEIKGQG
jgi:large subunit ribosomal protein L3